MLDIIFFLIGLYYLVRGRARFRKRMIQGRRARLVGLILMAPIPLTFAFGFAAGLYYGDVLHSPLPSYFQGTAIVAEVVMFTSAVGIAYWVLATSPHDPNDPAALENEDLVTIVEVAQKLGISELDVLKDVDNKVLPAVQKDNRTYIPRRFVESLDLLHQGSTFMANGARDMAISRFDDAIRLNPQNTNGYLERGKALHQDGKVAEAAADFRRFLALNPSYPQADQVRKYIDQYGSTALSEEPLASPADWLKKEEPAQSCREARSLRWRR